MKYLHGSELQYFDKMPSVTCPCVLPRQRNAEATYFWFREEREVGVWCGPPSVQGCRLDPEYEVHGGGSWVTCFSELPSVCYWLRRA